MKQRMKASRFVVVFGLLLSGCSQDSQSFTSSPAPSLPDQTTKPRTPLQEKVKADLERAAEQKKADAALPDRVRKAEIGTITTIIGPGTSWPCASSKEALKELMKWQRAMLDERAPDSVMNNLSNTLNRTRSIMVGPGDRVEILDKESGVRKISVIEHTGTYGLAYMAEAAQGCWVASEAVVR
jgi:hypothetical protein